MTTQAHLERFYEVLGVLRARLGGERLLATCSGRSGWPERGVYFFFEQGEVRGDGSPRVVRVGTHALTTSSRSTLWQRLSQHRGTGEGPVGTGGNHRGSIFRLHIGSALQRSGRGTSAAEATWGRGSTAGREFRDAERELERRVSRVIRAMPFLWLAVDDPPGPRSDRALIESSSIALLSRLSNPVADPPSRSWLGQHADRPEVRDSGLWNVRYVRGAPTPSFLDVLARRVETAAPQLTLPSSNRDTSR